MMASTRGTERVNRFLTGKVDFTRDVRPILSDKCFKCHGADPEARKGKLRLDTPEGTRAAGASGEHAVVPGDIDASELISRVFSDDAEQHMPPAKSGKTLSADEVAILKTWVEQGAEYTRHWAFVPPVLPAFPEVKNLAWCAGPIDRFVLAKLESEGLSPSPEADRVTLIRRVSLDLTGLPPLLMRSTHFSRINRTRPIQIWSIACSRRPVTASAGGGSGSTPHVMRIRTVMKKTRCVRSGPIATGSSMPTTMTFRTTSSCSNSLPATYCPTPRKISESLPASSATQ